MSIESEVFSYLNKTSARDLPCRNTIANGRETPCPPLHFLGGFRRKSTFDTIAHTDGGNTVITKAMVELNADKFDSAFRGSHRSVIHDANWLAFYNASPHPVKWRRFTQDGTEVPFFWQTGIPCWSCGIFLPSQAIQVDHSRPQAGEPMESVAKLFRHNGLTVGAPKGRKGRTATGNLAAPPAAATPQALADRYTLNPLGRMLFQIIVSAGQRARLIENARDNYANLRPMCAQCNTARNALPMNKF